MSVAALNKIPLSLNGREVVCGGPPVLRDLMVKTEGVTCQVNPDPACGLVVIPSYW